MVKFVLLQIPVIGSHLKKKILLVFGTRPEAIKMAPVFQQFQLFPDFFEVRICVTAQHRQMLDQVLSFFGLNPNYDLNVMKPGQNLHSLTADVVNDLKAIYEDFNPDYVLVHGDTTTSFAASLSAFYCGIKVAHIEAGLRTNNKWAPFPEEMNRQLTGRLADIHFAPTSIAKENLLKEGIGSDRIFITGNTVIDALMIALEKLKVYEDQEIIKLIQTINLEKKIVLVTGHRRENFGDGFVEICEALLQLALANPEIQIVYPVHLNPNVLKPVHEILGKQLNIHLIEPLSYPAFVWLMNKSHFIITDSGGIQEEAPSLRKPVLVMRETTERPEAVEAGVVKLVGTNKHVIVEEATKLLNNQTYYLSMSTGQNPYGNGDAARMIVDVFK
jgi:UDP-N-acetylglucosamine 2-epimerase (non-hydrolysing)